MCSIKSYFPYKIAREGQIEAINEINEAMLDNDYDYVVFSAGTGFGKSAVARTLCNYHSHYYKNDSFILTATKQLQKQYYDECKNNYKVDYAVATGRSNYTCNLNGDDCNNGDCKVRSVTDIDFKCPYGVFGDDICDNGGCEYWESKAKTILSDVAIMNYNVLMSDNQYVNHYNNRYLMICDEAHNIEAKIMNEVNVNINQRLLNLIGWNFTDNDFKHNDLDYWLDYLESMMESAIVKLENPDEYGLIKKETDDLQGLINSIKWKLYEIRSDRKSWIVCADGFSHKVQIKPLNISKYAYSKLLCSSEKHVFMSGSFIDMQQFCHDIGLDSSHVYFITAKSTFDMKNNNPIFKRLAGNMAYKSKAKTLPRTIPILKSIFNQHKDEKGLIHANSKEFANYIIENIDDERLMTYYSDDKDYQIERFRESENKIMVSYSMTEGVDLPYDDLRFQIFYKVPYLSLADNQVKARLNLEPNWYNTKTVQTIIQAWGRGMRSADDYCTNYLLDSGFNRILNDKSFVNILPTEFREAIR